MVLNRQQLQTPTLLECTFPKKVLSNIPCNTGIPWYRVTYSMKIKHIQTCKGVGRVDFGATGKWTTLSCISFSSFGCGVRRAHVSFNVNHFFLSFQIGFACIVPWGQWWCPILPKNQVDLHVVVGTPLALPTIPQPTQNDIDTWHGLYVEHLIELFDHHKGRFGIIEDLEVW